MFSLPILIVPFVGNPEVLATVIVVSEAVRSSAVVVLATSKSEARANVNDVTEASIPPESFKVV